MRQIIYRGCVYRLAAEDSPDDVKEKQDKKTINWQQHLPSTIPSMLRAMLAAPGPEHLGELALLKPTMFNKFGDPKLGYEIHGGIKTKLKIDTEEFGPGPYCFEAIVDVAEDDTTKELKEEVTHVEIKTCPAQQTGTQPAEKTPQVEVLDDGQ